MGSNIDADIIDAITWISKNDWSKAKEAAYRFSSTVTAAKADITLLKAELSGLAAFSAGASFAKFDYTFLKVDEKGITWRGEQIYSTKRADEAKHFQTKMERSQLEFKEKVDALKEAHEERGRKRADLDAANARLTSARTGSRAPNATSADFAELAKSADAQRKAQKAYEHAESEFRSLRRKAAKLQADVDTFAGKMKDAKPEKIFDAASRALTDFEEGLRRAAAQA
jgi:hypothetical protein